MYQIKEGRLEKFVKTVKVFEIAPQFVQTIRGVILKKKM